MTAPTMQIRKAERRKARLRVGASGPSGSGKTYSALLLARGIASSWDKIVLIDTENGSGELYSDLGPYNVLPLSAPFSPERYIEAIRAAEESGAEVIVIDSTSHEWDGKGGCLEINEKLASAKYRGNTWSAWSETTPRHQRFLEAITSSPCHVITTARSKTDTIQTEDKKIKKVGLKDIQREGFEYELTVAFNIDREGHLAIASKDRTKLFIDRDPFLITEETGRELVKWNESGIENPDLDPLLPQKRSIVSLTKALGGDVGTAESIATSVEKLTGLKLEPANFPEIISRLKILWEERQEGHGGPAGTITPPATPPAPETPAAETPAEETPEPEAPTGELSPATPDVDPTAFEIEEGKILETDATALVDAQPDETPISDRLFTREELDGSRWLCNPTTKSKKLIERVVGANGARPLKKREKDAETAKHHG